MEPRALMYDSKGTGEPIVLVPGGLTGWLSWLPHQVRLAAHCQAIRVQPIHNELGSAGLPGDPGYTADIEREALRLTLDALGLTDVHLVGWSSGGRAALEFTLESPERIRSLTLVEPAAHWVLRDLGIDTEQAESDAAFLDRLSGRTVTEDDVATFLVLAGFARSADEARNRPEWDRWVGHRMALSWQGALQRSSRTVGELSRVSCRTLLTKGADAGALDRRVVDELGRLLPRASVIELPGDHAHHIESIDEFLTALEVHVGGAAPGRSVDSDA